MASNVSDAYKALAIRVLRRWLSTARTLGWLHFEEGDGLTVWPDEVQALLSEQMAPATLTTVPVGSGESFTETINALAESCDEGAHRWSSLQSRLKLSRLELEMLGVLVALSTDLALARAFRYAWADLSRKIPPIGFIVRALQVEEEASLTALVDDSLLFSLGLLELEKTSAPLVERGVSLSNRACSWLSGSQVSDAQWVKFDVPDPPSRLRIEVGQAMRRLVSNGKLRAAVVGPPGSGNLGVTVQLAHVYAPEGGVYFAALSEHEGDTLIQRAVLHAALTGSMIVVEVSPNPNREGPSRAKGMADLALAPVSVVYLLSDAADRPKSVPPENVIRIGYPSREQRLSEWKHHLAERGNDDLCSRLAGSFILSEGQIEGAVHECFAQKANGGSIDDALFSSARAQSETGLGSLAQPELCTIGLDSVILDIETRTLVEELLAYAKHRHELAHDWGFEAAMPYGLGLTALFTGPPGTGKTLAATAIAKELGHELYRVDLSQLVSKYIGETEKHLAALFDAASKGGIMLLFDEADSVFGKRTEVRNSVDRYANSAVALQSEVDAVHEAAKVQTSRRVERSEIPSQPGGQLPPAAHRAF